MTVSAPVNEGNVWYRGWLIVGIAAVAMVATLPGRTVGLGMITEAILVDLEMERTVYAQLNLVATLIGAAFGLLAGIAVDRAGLRLTTAGTLACLAASVICMGMFAGAGTLGVFLVLSRGFGQSALSTCSMTMVGKWFNSHLSIALGVFTALVSVGFVIAISLAPLVTSLGWRTVWTYGGVALLGLAALVWLLVPSRQQTPALNTEAADNAGSSHDATLPQALRSPSFWIYTACTGTYYLTTTGLTLFYEDVMKERGLDRDSYEVAMAAFLGAGLLGNFAAGFAARRFDLGRLLCLTMALLSVYLFTFPFIESTSAAAAHAALFGAAGGAFMVLFFTGYAKAFGKTHLGKIQGVAQTFMVIASSFGPPLFAEIKAANESYAPVFSHLMPVFLALGVTAWFSSRWIKPRTPNQTAT
jgi:MFS family permease